MAEGFKQYLRLHTDLSDEQIQQIDGMATRRKLKRNDFLLREGEVCRHKIFVEAGMLRTFGMTADGAEHILQLSPENTWTLDVESYDNQIPSRYNIGAVEATEVLLWNKTDFEHLLTTIPQLKTFSQFSSHAIFTTAGKGCSPC